MPEFSNISASEDSTKLTVVFTTATSVASGLALFALEVGEAPDVGSLVISNAGAVASQVVEVDLDALYALGFAVNDILWIDVGYSPTDPAVSANNVWASEDTPPIASYLYQLGVGPVSGGIAVKDYTNLLIMGCS